MTLRNSGMLLINYFLETLNQKQDILLNDDNLTEISKKDTAAYMNKFFATIGLNLAKNFPDMRNLLIWLLSKII